MQNLIGGGSLLGPCRQTQLDLRIEPARITVSRWSRLIPYLTTRIHATLRRHGPRAQAHHCNPQLPDIRRSPKERILWCIEPRRPHLLLYSKLFALRLRNMVLGNSTSKVRQLHHYLSPLFSQQHIPRLNIPMINPTPPRPKNFVIALARLRSPMTIRQRAAQLKKPAPHLTLVDMPSFGDLIHYRIQTPQIAVLQVHGRA